MEPPEVAEALERLAADTFVYARPGNAALLACYAPLALFAAAANALLVAAVCRRPDDSPVNLLLVNLSVADLLVTFTSMPTSISHAINEQWFLGATLCKLGSFLQGVAVCTSVLTIMLMSVERFHAICRPLRFRDGFGLRTTLAMIAGAWLVSSALFVPTLLVRQLEEHEERELDLRWTFCVERWGGAWQQRTFGVACFVVVCAVPGCVTALHYLLVQRALRSNPLLRQHAAGRRAARERTRVARVLLCVALAFTVCWLPYNVLLLLVDWAGSPQRFVEALPFALLLGHLNSALNPLLCCVLASKYRKAIRQMLSSLCGCGAPAQDNQSGASSGLQQAERSRLRRATLDGVEIQHSRRFTFDEPPTPGDRRCSIRIAVESTAV